MRDATHTDIPVDHVIADAGEGIVLRLAALPPGARTPGTARDRVVARLAAQRGAAHAALVAPTLQPCHDVECVPGRVAAGGHSVDWRGDGAGMAAAVAVFALRRGLVHRERIPETGSFAVRIWYPRSRKTIVAHVPVAAGQVALETGSMARIRLEIVDPAPAALPTGRVVDALDVPAVGTVDATLIDTGTPIAFVDAADVGAGVAPALDAGGARVVVVAAPRDGGYAGCADADVVVRGAPPDAATLVALAVAAAIPDTIVHRIAGARVRDTVRVASLAGVVPVAASVRQIGGEWIVPRAVLEGRAGLLP